MTCASSQKYKFVLQLIIRKMVFSLEEKMEMLKIFYQSNENCSLASSNYEESYPERRQPDRTYFLKLQRMFQERGSLITKKRNRRKQNQAFTELVLQEIAENPRASIRKIALRLGCCPGSVHYVLKNEKIKPWKLHISNTLHGGDTDRRLTFCRWLQNQINNNEHFLSRILWTDESKFTNEGMFNRHNEHYWSRDNPREHVEIRNQHKFSLNCWVGILNDRIVGPYIFRENLNSERYLHFLQMEFEEFMNEIPLAGIQNLWFQQDGAPPHNSLAVRNYLTAQFGEHWIGNRGPVEWPARSPDFNPLDYYLWGKVKNIVYSERVENVDILEYNIRQAIREIRPRELKKAIKHLQIRLQLCITHDGAHFEHLL